MLPVTLIISLAVGCGVGVTEPLHPKGRVTLDGRDVPYGTIEFIPDAQKRHHGPSGNAEIVDGLYDTSAAGGKGLSKGPHIARVTAYPEKLLPPNPDETVLTKAPTPICIGFPVEVTVESAELDITVPATAKGFDMYKAGRPTGPRPGDP